MLSFRFAGLPISCLDGPGVPQLPIRGEQTSRVVAGSGGRLHLGMVTGIKSERGHQNPWPDCLGIRVKVSDIDSGRMTLRVDRGKV